MFSAPQKAAEHTRRRSGRAAVKRSTDGRDRTRTYDLTDVNRALLPTELLARSLYDPVNLSYSEQRGLSTLLCVLATYRINLLPIIPPLPSNCLTKCPSDLPKTFQITLTTMQSRWLKRWLKGQMTVSCRLLASYARFNRNLNRQSSSTAIYLDFGCGQAIVSNTLALKLTALNHYNYYNI